MRSRLTLIKYKQVGLVISCYLATENEPSRHDNNNNKTCSHSRSEEREGGKEGGKSAREDAL